MSLSRIAMQKIDHQYLEPLVQYFQNPRNLQLGLMQTMQVLQGIAASTEVFSGNSENKINKFCEDTKNVHALRLIGLLYFNKPFQQREFPNESVAAIQTYIREFFYRQMAHKVSFLEFEHLKSLLPQPEQTPAITNSGSLQFFPPFMQDPQSKIFFMLGQPLKVRQSLALFEFWQTFQLRADISKKEIIATLPAVGTQIKLYKSAYQALEAACSYNLRDTTAYRPNSEIPTIWAVSFEGELDTLKFKSKKLLINKNCVNDYYGKNERQVEVTTTIVERAQVTLLLGAAIFPLDDFASYKILNTVYPYEMAPEYTPAPPQISYCGMQ